VTEKGDRFGNLVAIREIERGTWELQCDCGNLVTRKIENLKNSICNGSSPKCRECHSKVCNPPKTEPKRLDIAGQQFGNLTAIEPIGEVDKRRYAIWRFRCKCGDIVERSAGVVTQSAKRTGRVPSCGKSSCNGHPKLPPGHSAINELFGIYRRNAKKRNLSFELTEADFFWLISQNCFYCGDKPKLLPEKKGKGHRYYGEFYYNGIDRLNNSEGYTVGNTVACCSMCNRAKNNEPLEDFLSWVNRLKKNFRY